MGLALGIVPGLASLNRKAPSGDLSTCDTRAALRLERVVPIAVSHQPSEKFWFLQQTTLRPVLRCPQGR